MEKEINEFLKSIINEDKGLLDIQLKAAELLDQEFKNEVRKLWESSLICEISPEYGKKQRELFKIMSKIDLVSNCKYYNEREEFILDNWERIDDILGIIKDYIEEIEKEATSNE